MFAEFGVRGDGSDWTPTELRLLGGTNIVVPVTFFDNGLHSDAIRHDPTFAGYLLFSPGALLKRGVSDYVQCCPDGFGELNLEKYYELYRERILPLLRWANWIGSVKEQGVILTIPGLGCGQFSGRFGHLGAELKDVLYRLLTTYGDSLPWLRVVYYDCFRKVCENEDHTIHHISFLVRPLRQPGNRGKAQLCRPEEFDESFSDLLLCSIVAWDHVSWPGNDWVGGSRATDDGVKGAATDCLEVLTGVMGGVYKKLYMASDWGFVPPGYDPPRNRKTWADVIRAHHLQLECTSEGRLQVFPIENLEEVTEEED